MQKRTKKHILAALLAYALAALAFPCSAADAPADYDVCGKTPDTIFSDLMAEYRLDETNFAAGCYFTATDETWYFNENKFIPAGSMYKLPLAMNYINKFADGSFDPEAITGGFQLTRLVDLAVRCSSNEAANLLQKYYCPDHTDYRLSLAAYSDADPSALPASFIDDNAFSPHIMLDTLKALYANRAFYTQVVDDMLLAHPSRYFCKYQGDYEIAHKYGYYEGALNDCGIIFTPHPVLLVAFTDQVWDAEAFLGTLAARLTDYALWLDSESARTAAEQAAADVPQDTGTAAPEAPAASPPAAAEPLAAPQKKPGVRGFVYGIGATLLLAAFIALTRRRAVKHPVK